MLIQRIKHAIHTKLRTQWDMHSVFELLAEFHVQHLIAKYIFERLRTTEWANLLFG